MGSVASVSSDAGWEWRFFVPVPLDEGELPLAGQREDIYFPAGEGELMGELPHDPPGIC